MADNGTRTLRRAAGGALVAAALLFAGGAHAQGDKSDVAAAANAFSRAQRAALKGDYARAAELFDLADSLAPSPVAVRSAVSARQAAGQLALAAGEAEELKRRYPDDKKSAQLADQIISEAKKKLARQQVTCEPVDCQLVVDGAAASTEAKREHVVYLEPGEHSLVAVFGDRRTAPDKVTEKAGEHAKITFHQPPPPPTKPTPSVLPPSSGQTPPRHDQGAGHKPASGGLSPWYFGTGAVITAALGGVSIWSGLDTLKAHDKYKQHETEAGYQDGLSRERRSNILFAATGVAAAATVTLALFTDFSGSSPDKDKGVATSVAASPDGAKLFVQGRF
jgi:hypothetical protein